MAAWDEAKTQSAKAENDAGSNKRSIAVISIYDRIIRDNQPQAQPGKPMEPRIGNALKRFCKELGWTPYQLSKQTGIDRHLVLGHIKNKRGCSLANRKKYADAFRVSIDDLES